MSLCVAQVGSPELCFVLFCFLASKWGLGNTFSLLKIGVLGESKNLAKIGESWVLSCIKNAKFFKKKKCYLWSWKRV